MIANENIKIRVHSKIISKLKKQNYKDIKIGDIVSINIKLLSKNSHTKIDVICQNCKKIKNISYQDYNKRFCFKIMWIFYLY